MKPIDFMDALSDVNEKYVRQMIESADEPENSRKIGSAVLNPVKAIRTDAGFRSEREQNTGTDRPLGGKMRYIALLASAAACIAGAVGIMHLYPLTAEDSMTADSMFSEVRETQPGVLITTASAADEKRTTTFTESQTTAFAVSTKAEALELRTAVTDTGILAGTQATSAVAAEEQTDQTVSSAVHTTALPAETTRTTTAAPEDSASGNTLPNDPRREDHEYVPFTQDALLGDVDGDGDITLLDYFWASREYYIQTPSYRNSIALDDDAIDRGNTDRLVGDDSHLSADGRGPSPISVSDIIIIRNIAVFRAWLDMPDLTVSDYIQVDYSYDQHYGVTHCILENEFEQLSTVFETFSDKKGNGYDGRHIIGAQVPEAVREFYNDAHTIPDGKTNFSFLYWKNSVFTQKMDELRALLEEN